MANGYPKQFPDYINLAANAEAEQAFPTTQPQVQEAPDFNRFGLHLNGAGLDSAALSVLNALQGQRMPRGAAGNFAAGLASGLAGGRVRQMQGRQEANAGEQKRVEREAEYRRRMVSDSARSMRNHQLGVIRDAAKAKGDSSIEVTPEIRKEAAANGIYIHPALKRVNPNQLVRQVQKDVVGERMAGNLDVAESDAAELLDGVMSGRLSPIQSELFSSRDTDVRRKFNVLSNQKGFNLLEAQRTHLGYKTYYNTLNGRLQLAVRQSVQNANGGLDLLSELNQQMGALIPRDSRFTVLNRAALSAAKQGVYGKEARDIAIQMDQQIGNLISELANVYQGGGVPTNEARKQAEANFYGKYAGQRSLQKNIELAKKDVGIRASAMQTVGPLTPGTPTGASPTPPVPAQPGAPVKDAPIVPVKPLGGMFDAVQGTIKKLRGK